MQVRDTAPGNGARTGVGETSGEYPRVDYPRPMSAMPGMAPGMSGDSLRLEPPSAAPRRRLPELVLGIFLVAGCALAAVLLAVAGRERTAALALANDVQRGQVITDVDLQTVYIGSDSSLAYLDPDSADAIVNQVALSDLPQGTLITQEQFIDPEAVTQAGEATIGLDLEAGQLPSLRLAPGDRVTIVAGGGAGGLAESNVVADAATVQSVTELEDNAGRRSHWWVSLRMSENDATAVAMANAGNARIQLVKVER
ncbi:MAG TPA: SAF domain-containing protein [Acidimicrobiales bacterium]|jgi:hypothetical protein